MSDINDDSDNDIDLNSSTVSDNGSPLDDEDTEHVSGLTFSSLRIATVTCLHKYAIVRMEGAQNELLPWPPLMLVVLSYLNKEYKRRELVTERNIAMIELLLHVPIQLLVKRVGSNGEDDLLDLNDDASLDYSGMSFSQSLEMLRDLVRLDVIKMENVRVSEEMLAKH